MISEGIFLIGLWVIQSTLYFLLTFKLIDWPIGKRAIFFISVCLCFIAPWLFPVSGGLNKETDEYICGLASLVPFSIFWFLGNTVNLILVSFFAGISWLRKR